jgi:hypothetical protein
MFGTLDAAFNYAVMAERIERTPGDAHKSDATKPVAVLSGGARAKQNAGGARGGWGRGGARGGRGVHKPEGRGTYHGGFGNNLGGRGSGGGVGGGWRGGGAQRGGRGIRGGRGGGRGGFVTPEERQCYNCGGVGHLSFACPSPRTGGHGGGAGGAAPAAQT